MLVVSLLPCCALLAPMASGGCHGEAGASASPDGGFDTWPASPDGPPTLACSDLVDQAPIIMIRCPTGEDCRQCVDGGAGAPIADGTYVAKQTVLWASGCGALANVPAHATIRIRGSTLDVAASGPTSFGGDSATFNLRLTFTTAGDRMTLQQLCPPLDPARARRETAYHVGPDGLFLESLPGVAGPTLFVPK
jgi:hypothetical protein